MKVSKDEKYVPITITLETKGEADMIWCLLNATGSMLEEITCKHECSANSDLKYEMWRKFKETHTVPKK